MNPKVDTFIRVVSLSLVFFLIGFGRVWLGRLHETKDLDRSGRLIVLVEESALIRGKQVLKVRSLKGKRCELGVTTSAFPEYSMGDVVGLGVEGDACDDGRVMFPTIEPVEGESSIGALVARLRGWVGARASAVLRQPYLGIVMGVVFGVKGFLLPSTKELFKEAGIIHILVASGYNVSVVVAATYSITLGMFSRKWSVLITVGAMLLYALVSGFDPPIVRALIMALAGLAAGVVGRERVSFLWLVYSAIIMIAISPEIVRSLSFQLSFGATFGVMTFGKRLERLLVLLPGIIREDVATTLSAQLVTMPIIWVYFGRFNPMSLVVNMLVLWAIPPLMFAGMLAIGLACVGLVTVAKVAVLPAEMLIDYVLLIARAFSC